MRKTSRIFGVMLAVCMVVSFMPTISMAADTSTDIHKITLSTVKSGDSYKCKAVLDGKSVKEYDYTWHADPSTVHDEVKNCPAEYYTGTEPDTESAAYIAHDIKYFPQLDRNSFKAVNYNGEMEWAYYYPVEEYKDYIFGTLPRLGGNFYESMMHSEKEAYSNPVLHITEPGTYEIEGEWHGQIMFDLGDQDEVYADENAKVNVILNGVDVTCTVAPAMMFYSGYECDNDWESQTSWSQNVNTEDAGVNVIIADGSENSFTGENVFRMLKTKYKDASGPNATSVKLQKKARKTDAAFYTYISMNIDAQEKGDGVLNITSGFEGLGSEHHLTINGGNINVFAQDDGINTNEDNVSVFTMNGGNVHLAAGLGFEGDGIDSNGYIVINDGNLVAIGNLGYDCGIDSNKGSYINGGNIISLGSAGDWVRPDQSSQITMNLEYSERQSFDDSIIIVDKNDKVVFAYDMEQDEYANGESKGYIGASISTPAFKKGETYHLYSGGTVDGEEYMGMYDISTVKGFSEDARLQRYSGMREYRNNQVGENGQPPEINGEKPPQNQGEEPPEKPDGNAPQGPNGEPPEKPDGNAPQGPNGEPPEKPEGQPEGQNPPADMPNGPEKDNDGPAPAASVNFKMDNAINHFLKVQDYDPSIDESNFSDVSASDWFNESVNYVSQKGIMNGTGNSEFSPYANLTRGMVVTVLYRMSSDENKADVKASSFEDVKAGSYYAEAVAWAAEKNIVKGYSDKKFGPEDKITREQMAAVLYRYHISEGHKVGYIDKNALSYYSDYENVSEYAIDAMRWTSQNKIITGNEKKMLLPKGNATRAEAAAIFMRYLEKIK